MKRDYNDPLYKKWRLQIYQRDNFKCQWLYCNCKKNLNAHHIRRWSDFPGLRYHLDNGITLCKRHHNLIKEKEDEYSYSLLKIVLQKRDIK